MTETEEGEEPEAQADVINEECSLTRWRFISQATLRDETASRMKDTLQHSELAGG